MGGVWMGLEKDQRRGSEDGPSVKRIVKKSFKYYNAFHVRKQGKGKGSGEKGLLKGSGKLGMKGGPNRHDLKANNFINRSLVFLEIDEGGENILINTINLNACVDLNIHS